MRKPKIKDIGLYPRECPVCGHNKIKVTRTENRKFFRLRKIVCTSCGSWTHSVERVASEWHPSRRTGSTCK